MTDPVAFAGARLDEEGALALDAAAEHDDLHAPPRPDWHVQQWADPDETAVVADPESSAWPVARLRDRPDGEPAVRAAHIARYDPARALRDVEAGRRVLARHGGGHFCPTGPQDDEWVTFESGERVMCVYPCADMLDLLYRWSDHPDYDESWKP